MTASPAKTRLHDLDAMRSILMMLGVVLHGANPYRDNTTWLVRDASTTWVLNPVVDFIHFFRMPAFFAVAGYFAAYVLVRRPVGTYVEERLTRLLVPFVAALVCLNIPQVWLLLDSPRTMPGFVDQFVRDWQGGLVVAHLWFLLVLSVHCVVLAIFANATRRLARASWPNRLASPGGLALLTAAAAAVLTATVVLDHFAPAWFHRPLLGLIEPMEVLTYSVFFAVGVLLYGRTELLTEFGRLGWRELPVMLLVLAITLLPSDAGEGQIWQLIEIAARWWLMMYAVRLCFGAFRRWASRESSVFRYLSDASYTVYLFHHILVVALATLLLGLSWPPLLKFTVVVSVTLALTLLIHEFLILRSPLLRLLFNGTRKPLPNR